jgi:hypothetical protein
VRLHMGSGQGQGFWTLYLSLYGEESRAFTVHRIVPAG